MASRTALLYLGVCVCVGSITSADEPVLPKNLRWISLDFTTILKWTTHADSTFTVLYSMDGGDWLDSSNCIQMTESECDLTIDLKPLDRTYAADIQVEYPDMPHDQDDLPHVYSSDFNPYRESNISAVKFTAQALDESRVAINITETLTGIHDGRKQLTIRDVLNKDLKYKISYYKAGSTGKKELITDSSTAEVTKLDSGELYCFIVAAYIPSRPKAMQQGAWGTQQCAQVLGSKQGLSLGALVGIIFILLTVLIVAVTVIVLCCKCCRQRSKTLQTSQTSAPI